jgi:hypothetical protein
MMKKLLAPACILFFSTVTFSQETVLVSKKKLPEQNKLGYSEEFYVLKSNKKIKHGSYVKLHDMFFGVTLHATGYYLNSKKDGFWQTYYTGNNNIKEKGYYKNDLPDSIWQYFYPEGEHKELVEVPSAEGRSELHIQNVNPVMSKFGVYRNGKSADTWEYFDVNEQPVLKYNHTAKEVLFIQGRTLLTYRAGYIGTEFHMYEHLYDTLDFHQLMNTIQNWSHQAPGKLVFTFTIDEQGAITNIVCTTKTVENKRIYARAMKVIESLNGWFYPRRVNGVTLPDQKTITFDLIIKKSEWGTMTEDYSTSSLSMNFNIKVLVE